MRFKRHLHSIHGPVAVHLSHRQMPDRRSSPSYGCIFELFNEFFCHLELLPSSIRGKFVVRPLLGRMSSNFVLERRLWGLVSNGGSTCIACSSPSRGSPFGMVSFAAKGVCLRVGRACSHSTIASLQQPLMYRMVAHTVTMHSHHVPLLVCHAGIFNGAPAEPRRPPLVNLAVHAHGCCGRVSPQWP